MKRLLFLFILFVSALAVKADDMLLQIWQADGQVLTIALSEEPVTRYADGNLIITTTKTSITYPLEKVRKYTYISTDGISSLEGMKSRLSQDGETLTFSGLSQGTEITIYSASGLVLRKVKSGPQSKTTVSVSDFPPGVYLVKVNSLTYKITKR
jgi:hypothetical protein